METKKKKRVGILGGTFDPPTIGHIQMAAEAINLRYLDEVWVVPCGSRKDKDVGASGEHRYNMTKLLIEDFFPKDYPVKVNDIEIKNGESIPTYPLMRKLMEDPANEKYDFFFIVGSDILDTLKTWDYGETMLAEIKFIIFIRIGYILKEESLPKNYIIVHSTFVASSSTEIRHRIRALRNWGSLDISHPGLQKRISSDQGQSFAKMYEINIREDHLRTIETGDDDDEVSAERKQLEDNCLGIFGIVPYSIIKYIKDNDLYLDKKTT